MDIVDGILADGEHDNPMNHAEDEAALLYGDETVDIRLNSPDLTEKNLSYFILKAPTQQFLQESYKTSQWRVAYDIKQKFQSIFMNDTTREIMAFIVINGSRHFHGYLMIENDLNEYQNLSEEEAKSKPLRVKWLRLCHVPYHRTTNILNSLNNDAPVKDTLNGKEISSDCASQLLDLIDGEPEETLETQKEKLEAYEGLMTKILSEEFELPSEENKVDDMEVSQGNGENDPKDSNKDSNKDKGSESSPKKNGSDSAKRRGRSRSRSADRNDLRRNKTGSSYLDLFDIVNMTYEEYLEAYRLLQMRAYDEYMMSIQNQPPMDMGPPMGPPGMGMGPPGMMPHHMPPPVHFPPDGFYGHPHMGPPPPHMMGGMMGGPPPGHFIGGRGGGFRGGRGF